MEVFLIGLGRMGIGIGRRLSQRGHKVGGYDRRLENTEKARQYFLAFEDLSQIGQFFSARKVVWIMVPHSAVDDVIKGLMPYLFQGDIVIDGGNSYYKDTQRRWKSLKEIGVHLLDVGVSGGVMGEEVGYCLMVGGEKEAFEFVELRSNGSRALCQNGP